MSNKAENQFQLLEQAEQSVMDHFFICSCLLVLKMALSVVAVSCNRVRYEVVGNPEDMNLMGMKAKFNAMHPLVTRCNRIVVNDLENIVPFFFTGMIIVMIMGHSMDPHYVKMLVTVYTVSRYLTTISHYFAIQPLRTVFWTVGYIVNAILLGHIIHLISPVITRYL